MEVDVNDLYKVIAESIQNSAKEEWNEAVLRLMVTNKVVEYNLNFFESNGGKKSARFVRPDNMSEIILDFHKAMTEGSSNHWNRAIFKLWPGGKFDMEFIWDQELHDEIERLNKK